MLYVIKADGRKEKFDIDKIVRTCLRAGTDESTAKEIALKVKEKIKNGFTTHFIYKLILNELEKAKHKAAFLLPLREAVSRMDPLIFELYFKRILEMNDYKCQWNVLIKGASVEHQVDIIASKDRLYLIECKHHKNPHRYAGLGVVLQVQARLEDILDGYRIKKNGYGFDAAWLVTNTKFSDHAKRYAEKKNIVLTGWRYQKGFSLEEFIHKKAAFPTNLLKIDDMLLEKLNGLSLGSVSPFNE